MPDLREGFRAVAATVGCDLWQHEVEAALNPCLHRPVERMLGRAICFIGTIPALASVLRTLRIGALLPAGSFTCSGGFREVDLGLGSVACDLGGADARAGWKKCTDCLNIHIFGY
jgi:hypothetical protein